MPKNRQIQDHRALEPLFWRRAVGGWALTETTLLKEREPGYQNTVIPECQDIKISGYRDIGISGYPDTGMLASGRRAIGISGLSG